METAFTIIGLIGVAMSLSAYALLTRGVFHRNDPRYYWINIIGTLFIALSITVQWNLAAMVSQVLWVAISLVGLVRAIRSQS